MPPPELVIQIEHLHQQPGSQPKRRADLRAGDLSRRSIEQHLALEIAEPPRRHGHPRMHGLVPAGAREDVREREGPIVRARLIESGFFKRAAKLVGRSRARHDHGAAA